MSDLHALAVRRVSGRDQEFVQHVCHCGYRTSRIDNERGAFAQFEKHLLQNGAAIRVYSAMNGRRRVVRVASRTIALQRPQRVVFE